MTTIVEDFTSITGTDAVGSVSFSATPRKNSTATGVVTSTPERFELVDGKLRASGVDPGPGWVRISIDDWEEGFPIIVPDDGEPSLFALIEKYLPDDSPTISEARTAANRAMSFAAAAEAAAADAGKHIATVTAARDEATAQAQSAAQSSRDAQQSATSVGDDAAAAIASRDDALAASAQAAQYRDQAQGAQSLAERAAVDAQDSVDSLTADVADSRAARDDARSARDAADGSREITEQARDDTLGYRDQAERFAGQAAEAAMGGIPDGSLGPSKFTDPVRTTLARADSSVQPNDERLTDARTPLDHRHTLDQIDGFDDAAAGLQGQLAEKADLDESGKLLAAQMPAQQIIDWLGEVGSQSAMVALVGQKGDWCTRTDTGTDWRVIAEPSSRAENWRETTYPASPVRSVNGRQGAVDTSSKDITDATATGRAVLTGSPAAGREALGAGTSSLVIGTTSATAMAGNRIQLVAELPQTPVEGVLYLLEKEG